MRQPSPGKVPSVMKDCEGVLKNDSLFVGQHVSLNHWMDICKARLIGAVDTSM
jgi:hypothetical protein